MFWDWLWEDQGEIGRDPFVALWPRGGAKSTNAERGVVSIGCRGHRHYVLYVCGTQDQADDHVQNIGNILTSPRVVKYYPKMSNPAVNIFGNSRGWRRNRLMTANDFTIDALGLDAMSARGIKIDDYRPDVIVVDDVDGDFDSPATTTKKIEMLKKKIFPAGASNVMIIFVQNLMYLDSIASRLARLDGAPEIDMLHKRIVSGPFPALLDFEYKERPNGLGYDIINGIPTWEGQSLEVCQAYVDTFGISSFISECQNDVDVPAGGIFSHLTYARCSWERVHEVGIQAIEVWCDPAVTANDRSDSQGIQADGAGNDGRIYRLFSWEGVVSPQKAIRRAMLKAVELGREFNCITTLGVETDQGGDTWISVLQEAAKALIAEGLILEQEVPLFKYDKAGAGNGPKLARGQQSVTAYERGVFVHVEGTASLLERAQRRFGVKKPYDLVDAGFYSWKRLTGGFDRTGAVGKMKPKEVALKQAVKRGYRIEG